MERRFDDSDDSDDSDTSQDAMALLVRPAIKRMCAQSCGVVGGQNDAACRLVDICYELRDSSVPDDVLQHVLLEAVAHECDAHLLRLRPGALALMSGLATDAYPENAAAAPLEASRSAEDDLRDPQWEREEWGILFGATPPGEEDRA